MSSRGSRDPHVEVLYSSTSLPRVSNGRHYQWWQQRWHRQPQREPIFSGFVTVEMFGGGFVEFGLQLTAGCSWYDDDGWQGSGGGGGGGGGWRSEREEKEEKVNGGGEEDHRHRRGTGPD